MEICSEITLCVLKIMFVILLCSCCFSVYNALGQEPSTEPSTTYLATTETIGTTLVYDEPTWSTCQARDQDYFCSNEYNCANYLNNFFDCTFNCHCRDGTVLESQNSTKCVAKDNCTVPPTCRRYESFESAGQDNICESDNTYYPSETPSCHCKNGYARFFGDCIIASACPVCGNNSYYAFNAAFIKRTCDNWPYYNFFSYEYNTTGCTCENEYVYDDQSGSCVLPENCSSEPKCPENSDFKNSGNTTTCNENKRGQHFESYDAGCYCKEGYFFDTSAGYPGTCKPAEECTCEENKEVSDRNWIDTCQTLNTPYIDVYFESETCQCSSGYYWLSSQNSTCVTAEECIGVCDINEIYNTTGYDTDCEGNIETNGKNCYCKEGYVRNGRYCRLQTDCQACGKNEEISARTWIDTCQTLDAPYIDVHLQQNTCQCKSGYYWLSSENSTCVTYEECIGQCDINEVYNITGFEMDCYEIIRTNDKDCYCIEGYVRIGRYCKPQTECQVPACNDTQHSKPTQYGEWVYSCESSYGNTDVYVEADSCICRPGYVFESANSRNCTAIANCNCGPHSHYTISGPSTRKTCDNWPYYDDFSYDNSSNGCICDAGYVYDETSGLCVTPFDCPTAPTCPSNSYFDTFGNYTTCEGSILSENRCYCTNGLVWDTEEEYPGKCIPANECNCTYKNRTGDYCIDTCQTAGTPYYDVCQLRRKCLCDNHFYWFSAENSTCVSYEDCVASCHENHTLTSTPSSACDIYPNPYTEGDGRNRCYCSDGYILENSNSTKCILVQDCNPSVNCGENKIFKLDGSDKDCTIIDLDCEPEHKGPGCYCKDGFVRQTPNSDKCIPLASCPVCTENQTINTELSGQYTCGTLRSSYEIYLVENSCRCKDGYVLEYANSTDCILIEDCTSSSCKDNELFGYRPNDDCSNLINGEYNYDDQYGCFCSDGFARNNGTCIPALECPVNCGQNEVLKASGYHLNCYTFRNNETIDNSAISYQCLCKDGYVRYHEQCVLPSECPVCDVISSGSYQETCMNVVTGSCCEVYVETGDCLCKDGYVLDYNNSTNCVLRTTCDTLICGETQSYKLDGPLEEDTCEKYAIQKNDVVDFGAMATAPVTTKEGCFCKYGYVRNSTSNECVPKSSCPHPPPCGENQIFKSAVSDPTCAGIAKNETVKPTEGCFCQEGYVRNYKQECVLPSSCPNCEVKDPNSWFSPCVHCYDYCVGSRNCSWSCLGDCDCIPGYVFGSDGLCVPVSSCNISRSTEEPRDMIIEAPTFYK